MPENAQQQGSLFLVDNRDLIGMVQPASFLTGDRRAAFHQVSDIVFSNGFCTRYTCMENLVSAQGNHTKPGVVQEKYPGDQSFSDGNRALLH